MEGLGMPNHAWGLAVVLVIGQAACAQTPDKQAPDSVVSGATDAKPTPKAEPVGEFATSDDLLKALESADKDLKSLSCELLWTKDFFLGGDTHTRKGKLFYVDERTDQGNGVTPAGGDQGTGPAASPGLRKFAIRIEATALQGGKEGKPARLDQKPEEWIFDGRSLVERHPDRKEQIRHAMANRPGVDPLKIGEGPIPLPVGQKREDILARFNVEMLQPDAGLVPEGTDKDDEAAKLLMLMAKGCVQLKLVPKPEFARECNFKEARLWYRRAGGGRAANAGQDGAKPGRLLPRMARAVDKQDNTDTVMLIEPIKVNEPLDDVFDTKVPDGWREQQQ